MPIYLLLDGTAMEIGKALVRVLTRAREIVRCFWALDMVIYGVQGQLKDSTSGACIRGANQYSAAADAVIAACRGVMCWEGR